MAVEACSFDASFEFFLRQAALVKVGPELTVGLAADGVKPFRGNFGEWFQNKGIPGDLVPWQAEVVLIEDLASVEDQVNVERS